MAKDETLIPQQNSKFIPCLFESEGKIKKDAPKAISVLRKYGCIDLVDILGLSPHMEESRENGK